jgi:hypothetical protein
MLRAAAFMALLYGAGLAGFETLINWGQWQWWPWWLVDYVAAALLVIGGLAVLGRSPSASALLTAGWGFALGMMWMSLAGNIEAGTDPGRVGRVAGLYVALIVASMVWCLCGLGLTLLALRRSQSKL